MKDQDIHAELSSIRNLMERSAKFISLSGLSGILAGVYAIIGAGLGYEILTNESNGLLREDLDVVTQLVIVAFAV